MEPTEAEFSILIDITCNSLHRRTKSGEDDTEFYIEFLHLFRKIKMRKVSLFNLKLTFIMGRGKGMLQIKRKNTRTHCIN